VGWFKRREEKLPAEPPKRRVHSIHRDALRLIMAASKEQHPREFGATLRAEKGVITEIVLTPGTIAGDRHTFINYHMLPIDPSVVGTVHSHPSPHADPSDADKRVFSAFGHTHIIIAYPYNEGSWVAYDLHGEPIDLEVVD
jgi:proteasome lid subunit RPN8/RPN11